MPIALMAHLEHIEFGETRHEVIQRRAHDCEDERAMALAIDLVHLEERMRDAVCSSGAHATRIARVDVQLLRARVCREELQPRRV